MSLWVLDLVKGNLEGQLFGSVTLIVIGLLIILAVFMWMANLPSVFIFMLAAPIVIAFAQSGLVPAYLWSVMIVILGVLLAMAFVKLFR